LYKKVKEKKGKRTSEIDASAGKIGKVEKPKSKKATAKDDKQKPAVAELVQTSI
jgi:hypothetical protein